MRPLHAILNKVVVQQFYQLNTGFFLMVFFLGFGIQQPATMLISPAFLTGAITSPTFIIAVMGLFTLYYFKCFNFNSKMLAEPENEFLYIAALFPLPTLRLVLGLVHLQLFLPALAYTILIGYYGVITGTWWVLGTIIIFNVVLIFSSTYFFSKQLRQTYSKTLLPNFFTRTEKKLFTKPVWWPLRYLLRQEKVTLVLTKVLALGLLYAFMALYPYLLYGLRPTQIGFLMAVTAHCMLVLQMQAFQETKIPFLRQLPYPTYQRFGQQVWLGAFLLLPELVLVLRFTFSPETIFSLISLYLFGLSILSLFQALVYYSWFMVTLYIRRIFFIFISLLLLLLCSPPLYLVAGLLFLMAYLVFKQYYYRYEYLDE